MGQVLLNLGCGRNILDGWDNYDLFISDEKLNVKKLDLECFPYPFSDVYADKILFSHILEHLHCNKMLVLKELHRILKPDGVLIVKLPLFGNTVKHTTGFHGRSYLNSILGKGKYDMSTKNLFVCEQFRYNFCSVGDRILGNILVHIPFFRRFDFILYGEMVWVLRKNSDGGVC